MLYLCADTLPKFSRERCNPGLQDANTKLYSNKLIAESLVNSGSSDKAFNSSTETLSVDFNEQSLAEQLPLFSPRTFSLLNLAYLHPKIHLHCLGLLHFCTGLFHSYILTKHLNPQMQLYFIGLTQIYVT